MLLVHFVKFIKKFSPSEIFKRSSFDKNPPPKTSFMKNSLLVIILLLSILSCRDEDDSRDNCTSNCTIVKGRIFSVNNEPVANVNITVEYRVGGSGSTTRKMVDVKTDKDGNYYKSFYVKDAEMGEEAPGYFKLNIDDSKIDINKYIRTNNLIGNTSSVISSTFQISKRDTIIENNLYIPQKTFIKVNLKNFVSQQEGDFFEVQTLYPFGGNVGYNAFLDSPYDTGFSGYGNWQAKNANTTHTIFVAADEKNVVRIFKRKNGINTSKDSLFFIPRNNNIQLNYNY